MTHELESVSYDGRLRRLERQNRRLRAGMAAMAVCLAAGLALGAAQSGVFGTITAERISIVDEAGNQVISIGAGDLGTGLAVYQTDGSKAALFGMSNAEQAGGLVLFDAEGRGRVGMGMNTGVPSLAFVDSEGHKRVSLGGNGDRYGIVVMDAAEKQRAALGLLDGEPVCYLADESGLPQVGMSKAGTNRYTFSMINEDGSVVELDD